MIDYVDKQHTIGAGLEQVIVVRVDWKSHLHELLVPASAVESSGDDRNFFTEVGLMSARCILLISFTICNKPLDFLL